MPSVTDTIDHVARARIVDDFWRFHERNPEVMKRLYVLSRRAYDRGARRIGIKQLFEVLRWERGLATADWSGFDLNNSYTAYYARVLMAWWPELDGLFEVRRLHGPDPFADKHDWRRVDAK
jgi:hypothetical protein